MRLRVILVSFLMTVLFVLPAFGATLGYAPSSLQLTIEQGAQAVVPFSITIQNPVRGNYIVKFVDSAQGNIPAEWISSSVTSTFASIYRSTVSTNLTITVPSDAPSGIYSAFIFSSAKETHGPVDKGAGFYLEINVPALCKETPYIEVYYVTPDIIWPPNHSMTDVTVTGKVIAPTGCTISSLGYNIEDEYGIYSGIGYLTITETGGFTAYLPVEASRNGQDKDGRHYTVSVFSSDEAGTSATDPFDIIVPHDQRGKQR